MGQIGCSTPSPPEGSHGTRADAASSPSAALVRGRRPAAPGPSLTSGAAPAQRGAAPARTSTDASPTRTPLPCLATAAPTRRGAMAHLPPSRGSTTRTTATTGRRGPGGPATRRRGPVDGGRDAWPGPPQAGARRGGGRPRPDRVRAASGPHTTCSVTRTLHSPLASPTRPHSTLHSHHQFGRNLPDPGPPTPTVRARLRRNGDPEPHRSPSWGVGPQSTPPLRPRRNGDPDSLRLPSHWQAAGISLSPGLSPVSLLWTARAAHCRTRASHDSGATAIRTPTGRPVGSVSRSARRAPAGC